MSTPREEPLEANEADVAEQTQEVAGAGSVGDEYDGADDEANEADVAEQRTVVSTDDDEDYPRS